MLNTVGMIISIIDLQNIYYNNLIYMLDNCHIDENNTNT